MKKFIRQTVTEKKPSTNRLITLDGNLFLDAIRVADMQDGYEHDAYNTKLTEILYSLRDLLWEKQSDVLPYLVDREMEYVIKVEDLVLDKDQPE